MNYFTRLKIKKLIKMGWKRSELSHVFGTELISKYFKRKTT